MDKKNLKYYLKYIEELEKRRNILLDKKIFYNNCKEKLEELKKKNLRKEDIVELKKMEDLINSIKYIEDVEEIENQIEKLTTKYDCLVKKINKFGSYSLPMIGRYLAKMQSYIEDSKYEYRKVVVPESVSIYCSDTRSCYVDVTYEYAFIKTKEEDLFDNLYVLKKSKCLLEKDFRKNKYNSKFEKLENLVEYDKKTGDFKKHYSSRWSEYIEEFIMDLTNYRLKNNMINISKEEMEEFYNIFMKTKGEKYKKGEYKKTNLKDNTEKEHQLYTSPKQEAVLRKLAIRTIRVKNYNE